MIGEHVLLKVSLIKGVMRFKMKGKLNLSYIVLFYLLLSVIVMFLILKKYHLDDEDTKVYYSNIVTRYL